MQDKPIATIRLGGKGEMKKTMIFREALEKLWCKARLFKNFQDSDKEREIDLALKSLIEIVERLRKKRYGCPKGCDKSEIMADIKNQIYNLALDAVITLKE